MDGEDGVVGVEEGEFNVESQLAESGDDCADVGD